MLPPRHYASLWLLLRRQPDATRHTARHADAFSLLTRAY